MIEDIELNDITHLWEHYKMLLDSTGDLVRYSQIYTKFMFSNLVKEFFEHNQAGEQKLEDVIQKVYELHNVQEVLELNAAPDREYGAPAGGFQRGHQK
ncbi:MAG: hypothetical protein V8R80_12300 [Eubacterium sp.]